jgi:hypothetical protein
VVVTIRFRGDRAANRPRTAVLTASVPPPVNRTSASAQPISFASCPRASSTACRERWPKRWTLLGFPYHSVRYGSIASTTSGAGFVVALLSR